MMVRCGMKKFSEVRNVRKCSIKGSWAVVFCFSRRVGGSVVEGVLWWFCKRRLDAGG